MKEGWTYKKLGEVATYHKEQGNFHDLPYVGMEHIESGSGKLLGTISSNNVLSSSFKFNKGEVLYGRLRPYLKKVFVAEFDGCCSTEVFPIYSDCIEPGFIKYWFLSDKITNMVNQTSAGCRMPRGNMNDVKQFIIGYPANRQEQQRIVSRLDSAFAHIDERKANAEKQLSEARALFQKALTKAMEPKEGWEEKKIREICLIKGGKRVPQGYKLETEKTDYPYIRVADFTDEGTISLSDIHYINSSVFQQIKNYTITDKDIYISIAGTIGKSGIIPSCLNGANLTENACKLVLNNGINQRYVYWFTKSDVFKGQISLATRQTSQPKLALTRLAEVCISLPPLTEQQRIVSRLDSLSAHVRELEDVLQKTIAECDALKQALLRKVFE